MHQIVGGEEVGFAPGDLLFADTERGALAHREVDVQLADLGAVVEIHDVAAAVRLVVVVGAHLLQVVEEVGLDLLHAAQLGHHRDAVGGLPVKVELRGGARHGELAAVVVVPGVLPVLGVPGQLLAQIAVELEVVVRQQRRGGGGQGDRQGDPVVWSTRACGGNAWLVHVVSPDGGGSEGPVGGFVVVFHRSPQAACSGADGAGSAARSPKMKRGRNT
ncbi:hypothetical protein D3C81_1063340 [compost metagenome]